MEDNGCNNASIEHLDLSFNKLSGSLPNSLGYLRRLNYLQLFNNLISGPIPSSIGNLSNLEQLDLSFNNMNGTIPESLGQLTKLLVLVLFHNSFEGVISEANFQNLTNLSLLSLSSTKNSLVLKVRHNWVPPFSLFALVLSGIRLSPEFPAWLKTQKQLTGITVSDAAISGTIPDWFWGLSPQILYLDLTHNNFKGKLPDSLNFSFLGGSVDLSFNSLEGSVPLWYNLAYLLLRNNLLSGPIPSEIGHRNALLTFKEGLNDTSSCLSSWVGENCCNWLGVGCSNQTGHVTRLDLHSQYCFLSTVEEDNKTSVPCKQLSLGGKLNPSLLALKYLNYLDLNGNNFQGTPIPSFIRSLLNLRYLDLSHSSFPGMVPANLGNLSKLCHLDLYTMVYSPTLLGIRFALAPKSFFFAIS
ncbi:LRR domain containing protein [Parasponia andersonii]|uniref:LRR domain containing protein n=1 Tax=Parasponia andersonii TaxID=3476 RepID=A0A2P5BPA7_PARAD|nr:LRR domain containing protein [Parasponia andersonii]